MTAESMYQEIILDHFRHPHNKGVDTAANANAHDVNTSCGDEIDIGLVIKDGKVVRATFDGKGCAISQAAASMLTDLLQGKTVREVVSLDKQAMLDELAVPVSGMRLKCALLAFKVAKMAAIEYEAQQP